MACFLLQRVYDEDVEESVPKADALEKPPEQVYVIDSSCIQHLLAYKTHQYKTE